MESYKSVYLARDGSAAVSRLCRVMVRYSDRGNVIGPDRG